VHWRRGISNSRERSLGDGWRGAFGGISVLGQSVGPIVIASFSTFTNKKRALKGALFGSVGSGRSGSFGLIQFQCVTAFAFFAR
jgi:hypothetical protein